MKKIIDCHTHLQNKELINEYFKNREGYAITLKALDSLIGNGDEIYSIDEFDNIFLCECIDAFSDITIEEQLLNIKKKLNKYKIIGIKIYLGYQPIFANDKKLMSVYKFCEENGLTTVFHCGVCAENLNCEKDKNYTSCIYIGEVAKKFPNVNFVVSHFDYPNFEDCLKVITENHNVFTDISGEYENFEQIPYKIMIKDFVSKIKPALKKYKVEDIINKIMFGSDYFGIGSGFDAVEEYIETLYLLFPKKYKHLFLYDNCTKAYPKILYFIKKIENNKKIMQKNTMEQT